jgi:hypothetical protein
MKGKAEMSPLPAKSPPRASEATRGRGRGRVAGSSEGRGRVGRGRGRGAGRERGAGRRGKISKIWVAVNMLPAVCVFAIFDAILRVDYSSVVLVFCPLSAISSVKGARPWRQRRPTTDHGVNGRVSARERMSSIGSFANRACSRGGHPSNARGFGRPERGVRSALSGDGKLAHKRWISCGAPTKKHQGAAGTAFALSST